MKKGYVFITGVSSGIGKHLALTLLQSGYKVIGSVRKKSDALDIIEQYPNAFKIIILDVSDPESIRMACQRITSWCNEEGLQALINNAGISVSGPLGYLPMHLIRKQLEVNLISVIDLIQQLLPVLGMNNNTPKGTIINMGSVSGLFASPFIGAYAISKHGLKAANDALRRELNLFGIKVVLIEAGAVKSEIWSKAKLSSNLRNTPFEFMEKHASKIIDNSAKKALKTKSISNVVQKVLVSKNPKARYLIGRNTLKYKLIAYWLPDRWVDAIIEKSLKRRMQ